MSEKRAFQRDISDARPLVVCLTSPVAAPFTAQCLSALGAVPVMPGHADDLPAAVARCDALLVNLGSSDEERAKLFLIAVKAAQQEGKPWVLDPVGAGGGAWRSQLARALAAASPSIIKGNPAEIRALAGQSAQLRGVDSLDSAESAVEAGRALQAAAQGTQTLVITGARDACLARTGQGEDLVWSQGGHPWAPRVVTMGCALGAVCAASAGVYGIPTAGFKAAQAFKDAAAIAGQQACGLGNFMSGFLDALDALAEPRKDAP